MILICETCHRHWKLPYGHVRHNSCSQCRHRKRSRTARARESARRIVREAPLSDVPLARCVTADELRALMDEADAKATRALEVARAIATRFRT